MDRGNKKVVGDCGGRWYVERGGAKDRGGGRIRQRGGGGGLLALETTGFLTQEAELVGTILVGFHNGFNFLSRLEMLWMVWNRCPAGERFLFN